MNLSNADRAIIVACLRSKTRTLEQTIKQDYLTQHNINPFRHKDIRREIDALNDLINRVGDHEQ